MMLSNSHEAKYAKLNRPMNDGSKEFECRVSFELYNSHERSLDGVWRKAQRRRGTRRPSKTSRSLLDVGDDLK
ncbi:hypothetical protein TNCT_151871 [Trichonephila clavata]|uniref:Uncharacterized protein n=1 Tax=Trichonephila clavata TaxID=2740835 RepID=A0A8X6JE17_TRICU|nr:hypothetical protein TNCT_151871 [Trichonephila clavata]